jgi:hypothetical protein
VFHDGFTFSIAYGNRAKVGLALVMVSAPACKKPIIREGGARFYESTIASTGFPAMIDGMSFGNDLSARLATHFGMDHPRQLPVLRAVYDMVPLGLVDERATRLATERTMRFALDWVEGCE